MADDTMQAGTDVIATDHVTSLNGAAVTQLPTSPKVQRVKAAFGDDGTSRDVSAAFPLPVALGAGTSLIGAVRSAPAATGTITSVAASAASVSLLTTNAARLGATFFNESTAVLRLALAATASATAYTVQVPAGGYYELPDLGMIYTGPVSGIWTAANGSVRITDVGV